MKKLLVIFGAVLSITIGIVWLLMVPVIERFEEYKGVSIVGGGFSHYNVTYIDHRPGLLRLGAASTFWRGMEDPSMGEWRQVGFVPYGWRYQWVTDRVLRDTAYQHSWFGVGRGTPEALSLQNNYEEVVRTYTAQSIFDRVWRSRVKEFH